LRKLYERIYTEGKRLNKADKLGIHKEIENKMIRCFSLAISAAYENKIRKREILEKLRIEIEVLKQLVRAEHEMHIISKKSYLDLSAKLQESSKMTNGWLKYLSTQNPATKAGLF